jgi:hypothetical protein
MHLELDKKLSNESSGCGGAHSIIPATWETEAILSQRQPGLQDPSLKKKKKKKPKQQQKTDPNMIV